MCEDEGKEKRGFSFFKSNDLEFPLLTGYDRGYDIAVGILTEMAWR